MLFRSGDSDRVGIDVGCDEDTLGLTEPASEGGDVGVGINVGASVTDGDSDRVGIDVGCDEDTLGLTEPASKGGDIDVGVDIGWNDN